ncbi:MAG: TonB-dependent receptor, partial [Acidobacteria bacterium]|nr:TonB-dependent receptor [Acidobacteriota bacterium]
MSRKFLLASLLLSTVLLSQTGQGIITGIVSDASGAMVPNTTIRLKDRDSGFTYSALSNEEGLYRAPYLNPGFYDITYEARGFKRLIRSGIQVRSTETARVDVTLEVGSVAEQVEVSARAALLETETSMTGHLVTGVELTKLPTPQMKVESMLWYVPGVTNQGGAGHSAGGRSRAFVLANDGVSGMTPGTGSIGTGRNMSTSQHAMEEIKVLTTALPAEYGHSGGGLMNINYKSGGNQLHGIAEERYMARHFIHRNWQDAQLPTNNFGFHLMSAMISGPIRIPKIYDGRNKTFFMWAFQRHHEKASENANTNVPSPAMLAGDFSFNGVGQPVFDPASLTRDAAGAFSRTQFPGNRIPLSRLDPVYQKFMSLNPFTPESNRFNQAFNSAVGPRDNLSADTVYRSYRTSFDNKIDHSFSDRHKIFGRWSYFRHRSFNGRWQIGAANRVFDFNTVPIPINHNQFVISDTYTLSPTLINEVRVGFNRRFNPRTPNSVGQNWAQQLGIPNVGPETMPTFVCAAVFTAECAPGQGGRRLIIDFPRGNSVDTNENFSFQNNITKVMGRHTFKSGYELMRTRHNVQVAADPSGIYQFGGTDFPFRPNTGNAYAAFMLGSVVQADFTSRLASWLPRWWSQAFYFQDDYKVNSRLTLNLGLRWQYESPFSTKYGQQSQFDPTARDPLTGRAGAILHGPGLLSKKDWNNFQPRIGLAYTITSKTVFRGGLAMNTLDLWTNGLNENFEEYFATATAAKEPGNPDIAFYLRNGPPATRFNVQPDGSAPFIGTNFGSRTASWRDPNLRLPYIMNWNGSVQHQLSNTILAEVSYQGSAGVGLLNRWDINAIPLNVSTDPARLNEIFRAQQNFRPFPQFGSIFHYANYGHSSFHSGTVKVEKRMAKGYSVTSFYTFGKSIDEASDDGAAGGITFYNRRLEKARSNYDVTHRWVTYALVELPFGKGRKWMNSANAFVNGALGGWELNMIQTVESGVPMSFTFAGSPSNYLAGALRPDMVAGRTYDSIRLDWDRKGPCRHQTGCRPPWADINAFAYPAAFTAGNSGRNVLTGPGNFWHQVSISKTLTFRERLKGTLRYDINNPFKYYFFNNPTNSVDLRAANRVNFGQITGNQGSFSGLGGRTYQQIVLR